VQPELHGLGLGKIYISQAIVFVEEYDLL